MVEKTQFALGDTVVNIFLHIAWTRNFTFRDFEELATRFLKQKSGNSSRLLGVSGIERWLEAWLKKNFFNRGKWMTLIA